MGLMASGGGGVEVIKGSFTVPSNATSYTLSFGKTLSGYLFQVEASADSKTAIMSSGSTYARTIVWTGYWPKKTIGGNTFNDIILANRVQPSTGTMSNGVPSPSICSDSGLTFSTVGVMESGWAAVVKGETYDYIVIPLDNL